MSEIPPADVTESPPVGDLVGPSSLSSEPEVSEKSQNETLPQEEQVVVAESAKEEETAEPENPEAKEEDDEDSAISISDYVHQLDPEFVTPDVRKKLDEISGLVADDGYGQPGEEREEPLTQGPSYDSSLTANRLRELIFGDGENPGLRSNRARLLSLQRPPDYEDMLVKEYNNEKEQLENAIAQQFNDLVALAEHYFNDPAKIEAPIISNFFKADRNNIEVTISMIMERIGIPEEGPEPEEYLNPSRIPARS